MRRTLVVLLALTAACTTTSAPQESPTTQTAGPPVVFLAIGGDETFGVDLPHDDRFRLAWPQLVYRALPARATFTNLGTRGATTTSALATQLPIARSLHPTIVVVWLTGDAAAGIPPPTSAANLLSLLRQLRSAGVAKLVVVIGSNRASSTSYDDAIKTATQQAAADLVDLTTLPVPLGVSGHRAAADAISAAIGPVH